LGKVLPMTISGTAEDGSITLRWVKPEEANDVAKD